MTKTLRTSGSRAALLTIALILVFGASQALAATGYSPQGSFAGGPGSGTGELATPERIAVDWDGGDVYVVDSANDRVQVFEVGGASATYLTQFAGFDEPYGIAIDQSASPISIYVSDAANDRIVKLDSNGADTPVFTPDAGFTSPALGGAAGEVGDFHADVEVDPANGDLLVADPSDNLVQRYSADGTFLSSFDGTDTPDGAFTGLVDMAVDDGTIYVLDSQGGSPADGNPSRVLELDALGAYQDTVRPLSATGDGYLAVDPNNSNLLVGNAQPFGNRIDVFNGGSHVTGFNPPGIAQYTGLAVDGATTGRAYAVSDDPFCGGVCGTVGVNLLDPVETATVTVDAVTDFDAFSAHFTGTVDPNGGAATTARFEYSTDQESWVPLPVHDGSTDPGLDGGDDPVSVTGTASGLTHNTTYYVRLSVEGPAGPVVSPVEQFTTVQVPPPSLTIDPASAIGGTSANFSGTVDSHGYAGTYRFEIAVDDGSPDWAAFGDGEMVDGDPIEVQATRDDLASETSYLVRLVATNVGGTTTSDAIAFATPESAPTVRAIPGSGRTTTTVRINAVINPHGKDTTYFFEWGETAAYGNRLPIAGESSAGAGTAGLRYSKLLTGLQPDTDYHYRVVATSSVGMTTSEARVVRTLAEDRAFEQVSPTTKNGNNISLATLQTVQTTPSGDGAAYVSNGAFVGSKAAYPMTPYVSRRTSTGWETIAPTPPQLNTSANAVGNLRVFSEDLSKSVSFSKMALASGAVQGDVNVYTQDNFAGTYDYVGGSASQWLFVDATNILSNTARWPTPDMSHVLLETYVPLTPDAPTGDISSLYEIVDGEIRLISYLPDGTADPVGATTGSVDQYRTSPISDDGRRIVFAHGGGLTAQYEAPLYLREDGQTTIALSASRRPGDDAAARSALRGPISPDGSDVFFASRSALTVDATDDNAFKLYRYEVDADELTMLTPTGAGGSPDPFELSVKSVNDDGSIVYFTSWQKFLPGATAGSENAYVWREGDGIELIAKGPAPASSRAWSTSPNAEHAVWVNREVYAYDATSGVTSCASCDPTGTGLSGASTIHQPGGGGSLPHLIRAVTDDGDVFFESTKRLVPEDSDGKGDVYQWHDGQLDLISVGTQTESNFSEVSEDGRSVFFLTGDRLVGQDQDSNVDLYVSRVGGGFASQNPAQPPAECVGEGCHSGRSQGPATDEPASLAGGKGNPDAGRRASFAGASLSRLQKVRLARGAPVRMRVRVNRRGVVTARARARIGAHATTVASASRRAGKAGVVTLALRLSKASRRALARRGTLRLTLAIRFSPVRTTQTQRFSLQSTWIRRSTVPTALRGR
jgi:hypothetical protein